MRRGAECQVGGAGAGTLAAGNEGLYATPPRNGRINEWQVQGWKKNEGGLEPVAAGLFNVFGLHQYVREPTGGDR